MFCVECIRHDLLLAENTDRKNLPHAKHCGKPSRENAIRCFIESDDRAGNQNPDTDF
jgi:hypothetical protein